jgi:hypothetical protein
MALHATRLKDRLDVAREIHRRSRRSWQERELFRGASILWLVDNLGVLSCFCKGSSSIADFGCLIHSILLATAGLDCLTWFDHVQSKDNVSDGGSRGCRLLADQLGFHLKQVGMPPWPSAPLEASPAEWLSFLRFALHQP